MCVLSKTTGVGVISGVMIFYPRTIRDWNALHTDTATAKSLESFKTHLLD